MPRTEVVDGGLEADRLVGSQDVEKVIGIDLLGLGEFEDQPIRRETSFFAASSVKRMQALGS